MKRMSRKRTAILKYAGVTLAATMMLLVPKISRSSPTARKLRRPRRLAL